ncbi:MAG: SMC-Scp complex subunit ScpB [Candidatus Moranbacteria bacterium]|nr:SMC-Scp complex subunit ScpB [Candidatus Moranbacteria bacterium]
MAHAHPLSVLESLLFVSGEPVSVSRIAKILEIPEEEVRTALDQLAQKYGEDTERGLMLVRDDKTALLATKPENASVVESLTKSTLQENMSKAALEVLAIIAYRAPIARVEIDAIRGVNCSFTLRNLLLRDLISREGNPSDSRGYLYRPTLHFLQVLGIEKVSELPQYEALSQDERLRMILEQEAGAAPEEALSQSTENENK